MRHLYNMVMLSQEGEVVAIYVNLAYPVCSFGALSETIRKSQTRSPEDQTESSRIFSTCPPEGQIEASGMLLPVLISQCSLLYMCVFRLCPHFDHVCLSFSTHPSVVKPKSVINCYALMKSSFCHLFRRFSVTMEPHCSLKVAKHLFKNKGYYHQ